MLSKNKKKQKNRKDQDSDDEEEEEEDDEGETKRWSVVMADPKECQGLMNLFPVKDKDALVLGQYIAAFCLSTCVRVYTCMCACACACVWCVSYAKISSPQIAVRKHRIHCLCVCRQAFCSPAEYFREDWQSVTGRCTAEAGTPPTRGSSTSLSRHITHTNA